MSKQRRTFSAEFKREAAALVLDQGYSHINDSAELKLSPHPLGKEGSWRANPSLGSAKMPVAQKVAQNSARR
ncbi:transposase [Pseudomonas aeruginosa]|uniref:transposase n=1 Tax=Pseudomonas aeruginosa TaxID=287 RepID=UPI0009ADCF23|nr:transposase [Pseudomonas aeruginosa]MDP5469594.1 transposase [Pseudomonas aeruginosa]OPD67167.1 hypothetical protein AO881_29590 [Pseudomonas aeruginosa]HCF7065580.1 transposase [Pseudomonas aeruginosa]